MGWNMVRYYDFKDYQRGMIKFLRHISEFINRLWIINDRSCGN